MQDSPPRRIEFWFDFGSNYSYISAMRIAELAARNGVEVAWNPFLLGPIFKSFGWDTSPFVLQKEKGAYTWKDMARQCKKYGLPWRQPSSFPRAAVLPSRVALFAQGTPWHGEFCRRVFALNFAEDRDVHTPEAVTGILEQLGVPAAEVLQQAQSDAIKLRLRQQTEMAVARGVFGAPTFFAAGEMFWGNDRLEDALAHAAGTPPAGSV
ncbi:2-hydroxychromene-2-carboxylate isomerase [Ramlibacter sp.]|uniref:2-hydroxychromene-2-carboxylate isomerase n=1 Tax=Ramlibacter sp. TaxID=1917967 RepID=UPI001849ED14|nr:2-hydroxychromene-2-carboxylate isomerase [Ramlibacter sp.]MBA2673139.1 2-hydroxychromene-2-carboxylate isomerase [Ramlibacter sp.]